MDIKPEALPATVLNRGEVAAVDRSRQFRQAVLVWLIFFLLLVLFNGAIPFAFGVDVRGWTASPVKSFLFGLVFYAGMFLAVPLILIKGWDTVRQPAFLVPLCIAMLGIAFWHFFYHLEPFFPHKAQDISSYYNII